MVGEMVGVVEGMVVLVLEWAMSLAVLHSFLFSPFLLLCLSQSVLLTIQNCTVRLCV